MDGEWRAWFATRMVKFGRLRIDWLAIDHAGVVDKHDDLALLIKRHGVESIASDHRIDFTNRWLFFVIFLIAIDADHKERAALHFRNSHNSFLTASRAPWRLPRRSDRAVIFVFNSAICAAVSSISTDSLS